MPKVTFVNEKRDIEVPEGANLREEALKAGIQMNFQPGPNMQTLSRYLHCRGHGTCGTCLVLIKKGQEHLAPKSGWEKFRLGTMMATVGREEEARLACQATVKGDCTVVTNPGIDFDGENFWQKPYPNK
jgi:2Fe-2S ferredoxin